ncbi:unnamed protein product [Haemonchus placei]|uniref:Anoctamin n=1 Tax=Haemonchus placei TaxID=6290 RepID=A0A0N4W4I8_HAEPC|nr:unnamed protein product [Haemonchus placei]
MGSLGVGHIFQNVLKPTLRLPLSDLAFVSTLPEHYLPDLVRENIGRVKWDELRRNGDGALEDDVSAFIPAWKKTLKLLKILLPHVGLNILLLSYITMGAIMFIWLEADHELQNRKVNDPNFPSILLHPCRKPFVFYQHVLFCASCDTFVKQFVIILIPLVSALKSSVTQSASMSGSWARQPTHHPFEAYRPTHFQGAVPIGIICYLSYHGLKMAECGFNEQTKGEVMM